MIIDTDSKEFKDAIKEYLKENLSLDLKITDPPYQDNLVFTTKILLDDEVICEDSAEASYHMIGKKSNSNEY